MKSLIAQAHASADIAAPVTADSGDTAANATLSGGSLMTSNILMIVVMILLFYVLLIRPQQKRYKKHQDMIDQLKKGDRVVTAAGFIGTVDKMDAEKGEVVIDLGGGLKVTALRSSIQNKASDTAPAKKE